MPTRKESASEAPKTLFSFAVDDKAVHNNRVVQIVGMAKDRPSPAVTMRNKIPAAPQPNTLVVRYCVIDVPLPDRYTINDGVWCTEDELHTLESFRKEFDALAK